MTLFTQGFIVLFSFVAIGLASSSAGAEELAASSPQQYRIKARRTFCDILSSTQKGQDMPNCEKILRTGAVANEALTLLESQEEISQEGCGGHLPGPKEMQANRILDASENSDITAQKAITEYCPRLSRLNSSPELVKSCMGFLRNMRGGSTASGGGVSGEEKKAFLVQLSKAPSAQVLLTAYLRKTLFDRAQQDGCLAGLLKMKNRPLGEIQPGISSSNQHEGAKYIREMDPAPAHQSNYGESVGASRAEP